MNIEMYRIFFEIQKKHWWFVARKKIIMDLIYRYLNKSSDIKILDIGCGSGLMLNVLEDVGQTYGMDVSDEAINFSKQIFRGKVAKGFLPDQIPYQESFFDLITALDVIEHVEKDDDSLKAIYRLLVPGGKAVITVPAFMLLWSRFDELNEHKRRYTLQELKSKLLHAGFDVEKISYYNTLLFPVVFFIRMFNNAIKRNGASDIDMPNFLLNSALEKIFSSEKYILKFLNLPIGVSILAVVGKRS